MTLPETGSSAMGPSINRRKSFKSYYIPRDPQALIRVSQGRLDLAGRTWTGTLGGSGVCKAPEVEEPSRTWKDTDKGVRKALGVHGKGLGLNRKA